MRSVFIGLIIIFTLEGIPFAATEHELSIEEYSKALEKAPESFKYKYFLYRGEAYSRNKNYPLAIKDFSASLSYSDTGVEGYTERGKAFLNSKLFGSAALDFGKALAINPKSPELYKYRAEAFAGYGKFDLAISDATQMTVLNSGSPNSLAFLADIYIRKGDYKAAKALCEKALLLDFNNLYALRVKQAAFEHEPEKIVFGSRTSEKSKPVTAQNGHQSSTASGYHPATTSPATASTPAQPRGIHEYIQAARSVGKE